MNLTVMLGFGVGFVIDFVFGIYALSLASKIGTDGFLGKATRLIGFSAILYAAHNGIKAFLDVSGTLGAVADTFEILSGLMLASAVYSFYKMTRS
jgi:hypothetical protein